MLLNSKQLQLTVNLFIIQVVRQTGAMKLSLSKHTDFGLLVAKTSFKGCKTSFLSVIIFIMILDVSVC